MIEWIGHKVEEFKQLFKSDIQIKGSIISDQVDGSNDIKIISSADNDDFCTIATTTNGATKITTVDGGAAAAHFEIEADGHITLDAAVDIALEAAGDISLEVADDAQIILKNGSNPYGIFTAEDGAGSEFFLYERGGSTMDDYLHINVTEHGATLLKTYDNNATAAHFELEADGDITLDSAGQIKLEPVAGNNILLDGTVTVDGGSVTGITTLGVDSVSLTAVQTSGESFVDNDTSIMTSAALEARYGRTKQIINLQGYAVLEDDNYLYAEDYVDTRAPWKMTSDYGSGTIDADTEVNQKFLLQAGGFHVPFACTISALQVQGTINGTGGGNMSVAIVEYRPSELSGDQADYPRTVYETVVVGSNNNANKTKTVNVDADDLDASAIPAGSHLLIMVKGDSDTDGDTGVVRAAIGLSW